MAAAAASRRRWQLAVSVAAGSGGGSFAAAAAAAVAAAAWLQQRGQRGGVKLPHTLARWAVILSLCREIAHLRGPILGVLCK